MNEFWKIVGVIIFVLIASYAGIKYDLYKLNRLTETIEMAKKQSPKRGAPAVDVEIPDGFSAVSGVNTPAWDFSKDATLQAHVLSKKEVKKGGKILSDTRVLVVKTSDGDLHAVWESALLGDLFDQAEAGDEVYMQFVGTEPSKKKGQSDTKLFKTGIKKAK